MDELLKILNQQVQELQPQIERELLHDRRMEAFKFFNSAYNYTGRRQDEKFDGWEFKILFGMNHAVGLPSNADRDELRREIAYARYVIDLRLASNPPVSDVEQRLFDLAESFKVEV